MKVELDKRYPMPASAELTWRLLQDIEAVAGCMPGAKITERVDDSHYKGTVAVKFGPASMSFRGTVEVVQADAAVRTMRLLGKGTDATGSSGAAMDLTASVEAADAVSCTLVGHSEVSMSGKAATFGGRMMGAAAEQLLKQFAANFEARVKAAQGASPTPAPEPAPRVGPTAVAAASAPASPASASAPASALPTATAATPALASAPAPTSAALAAAPAEPAPMNGLALLWAMVKDWLRSLFAARRA